MKKIAVKTVKAFLKERVEKKDTAALEFPVGDSSFTVHIKTKLTMAEKSVFVARVAGNCFDQTGIYRPEFREPMIRATVIQMCTDLPVLTVEGSPADMNLDAMNDLYCAMDLDHVKDAGYQEMLTELKTLCWESIEWRQAAIHQNTPESDVMGALSMAADSVRELMETLAQKANGVDLTELTRYAGQLSKATEGLEDHSLAESILRLQAKASAQ